MEPLSRGERRHERRAIRSIIGEKSEKPAPQLTDTERQALFDEFLKWYQERSVFGGRERWRVALLLKPLSGVMRGRIPAIHDFLASLQI